KWETSFGGKLKKRIVINLCLIDFNQYTFKGQGPDSCHRPQSRMKFASKPICLGFQGVENLTAFHT
ncbi:hypothetical protein HMPREF0083_00692, partial [Aneurinibacillus aneurinilyticus ATCC 12856]